MGGEDFDDSNFRLDPATTKRSIQTRITNNTYERLFDNAVPASIHSEIDRLIDDLRRLDDNYFDSTLEKLHTFLSIV